MSLIGFSTAFWDNSGLFPGENTGVTAASISMPDMSCLPCMILNPFEYANAFGVIGSLLLHGIAGTSHLLSQYMGNELVLLLFTSPLTLLIMFFVLQILFSKLGIPIHFFD
jgi:hypothetical protein